MLREAPSWSWASVKGQIFFRRIYDDQALRFVTLLDVSTTLAGEDPMGQVTGGHVRLFGHMCRHSGKDRRPDPTNRTWTGDWYDTEVYQPPELLQRDRYLLPFVSETPLLINDETEWRARSIRGIILESVLGDSNTYKRLGTFAHPWGQHRTPKEVFLYPEFADFDLCDFERQIITII